MQNIKKIILFTFYVLLRFFQAMPASVKLSRLTWLHKTAYYATEKKRERDKQSDSQIAVFTGQLSFCNKMEREFHQRHDKYTIT